MNYLVSECRANPEVFSADAIAKVQDMLKADFPDYPFIMQTDVTRRDIERQLHPELFQVYDLNIALLEKKAAFSLRPAYWIGDKDPPDKTTLAVDSLQMFLHEFFGIESDGYWSLRKQVSESAGENNRRWTEALHKSRAAQKAIEDELENFRHAAENLVRVREKQYPEGRRYGISSGVSRDESPWTKYGELEAVEKIMNYVKSEGIFQKDAFRQDIRQNLKLLTNDGDVLEIIVSHSMDPVGSFSVSLPCKSDLRLEIPLSTPRYETEEFSWCLPYSNVDFGRFTKEAAVRIQNSDPIDRRLRSFMRIRTTNYGTDISVTSPETHAGLYEKLTHIMQVACSVHLNRYVRS